jgi:hypothetical protein
MRKASIVIAVISLAFFFLSCASSEPGPVKVIGAPQDLVALTGEWAGTYEGSGTGRSGSITFHLTENPDGAHGDVLMVPRQTFLYDREGGHQGMTSSSGVNVLSIEFVRISAGEISGKIAPYPDPEVPDGTLETHFTGRLDGDWIEGTFVTYSDHGVSPRRGKWRVHRKPAA